MRACGRESSRCSRRAPERRRFRSPRASTRTSCSWTSGLPGIDGTQVLRTLREWGETPVVVLTVRDTQVEKVMALDAGATDYITKPFNTEELLARIRATLRLREPRPPDRATVRFEVPEIDLDRRRGALGASRCASRPWAAALGAVREQQRSAAHARIPPDPPSLPGDDRQVSLRVHVRHLRQKLGDASAYPRVIGTEPGLGYRWLLDDGDRPRALSLAGTQRPVGDPPAVRPCAAE